MKPDNEVIQDMFDVFLEQLFHEVRLKFNTPQASHIKIHHDIQFETTIAESGIDVDAIETKWLQCYLKPLYILIARRGISMPVRIRYNPLMPFGAAPNDEYEFIMAMLLKTDEEEVIVSALECSVRNVTFVDTQRIRTYVTNQMIKFGFDNGFYSELFKQYAYNNPDAVFHFNETFEMFLKNNELKYADIMLSGIDEVFQLDRVNRSIRFFEEHYEESERPLETIAWLMNKQHELIRNLTETDEMVL